MITNATYDNPTYYSQQHKPITCRQMCEHIVKADFIKFTDGTKPSAEDLYNYNSTGDLSHLFWMYKEACKILDTEA